MQFHNHGTIQNLTFNITVASKDGLENVVLPLPEGTPQKQSKHKKFNDTVIPKEYVASTEGIIHEPDSFGAITINGITLNVTPPSERQFDSLGTHEIREHDGKFYSRRYVNGVVVEDPNPMEIPWDILKEMRETNF